MKLRATLNRMLSMCPAAWCVFLRGLQLGCVLLLAALIHLIAWDGDLLGKYTLYIRAMSLNELCQAVLLLVIIGSACIEDFQSRGR